MEESLIDTAKGNSTELFSAIHSYGSLEDFLQDDDLRLSARPTSITRLEHDVLIDKQYDIDGVVVELQSFSAIKAPLNYLLLKAQDLSSVHPVYDIVKKHLQLDQYDQQSLKSLKNSHGIHFAYVNGWRFTVCLIPELSRCNLMTDTHTGKSTSLSFFKAFCGNVVHELTHLAPCEMGRPSIQKNSLHDTSHMNILSQDHVFIMNMLDQALGKTICPSDTKVLIMASKFGQKEKTALIIPELFHHDLVKHVTVHSAVTLDASAYSTHLFWARQGIQEIVGDRGVVFCCLSLAEAANFQTNLDGRLMDVSAELRQTAKFPTQVTFMQLYADTPHARSKEYTPHPVSGAIGTCGLLHHQSTKRLMNASNKYMQTMEENAMKLCSYIHARLEIVTKLNQSQITEPILPSSLVDENAIVNLCERHPMLQPFYEYGPDGCSFISQMQAIPTYLCQKTRDVFELQKRKGGFLPTWQCFQCELCLEYFFWGKTISYSDQIYATNLGPGDQSRSVTAERGILGMTPPNSTALPGSPPPLKIWVRSELQQQRVRRLFGFSDCINASDAVVGRNLIYVALLDLFETDSLKVDFLKSEHPPVSGVCTGSISLNQASQELCKLHYFKYPFTYGRACEMLVESGRDLEAIIKAGLLETSLRYFPALKSYNAANNQRVSWNKKSYWQLILPGQAPSFGAKSATVAADVMIKLVSDHLTFERNLLGMKENGLPWMEPIIKRLDGMELDSTQVVHTCTFLTCIACIQQGIYIDYQKLSHFELDLPIKQRQLQELEILSKNILPSVTCLKIFKLHDRIPFKIPTRPAMGVQRKTFVQHSVNVPIEEDLNESIQVEEQQHVIRLEVHNLPANCRKRWLPQELELLQIATNVPSGSYSDFYKQYKHLCLQNNLPTRSFSAFKCMAIRCKNS